MTTENENKDARAVVERAMQAGPAARTAGWALEELAEAIRVSEDDYNPDDAVNMLAATCTVLMTLADAVEFLGTALLKLDGMVEEMRTEVASALGSASEVQGMEDVYKLVEALLRIRVAVFPDIPWEPTNGG